MPRKNSFIFSSLLCALYFFCSMAFAGWFGPSNYPECVMGKMKGQPSHMMETARKACDLEFPCPAKGQEQAYEREMAQCKERGRGIYEQQLREEQQLRARQAEVCNGQVGYHDPICDQLAYTPDPGGICYNLYAQQHCGR